MKAAIITLLCGMLGAGVPQFGVSRSHSGALSVVDYVTEATGDARVVTEPVIPPICSQFSATKFLMTTTSVNLDPYNSTYSPSGSLGGSGGTSIEPSSSSTSYVADETLDNTALQAALNACPSGQAVEVVAGSGGQRAVVMAPFNIPSGVWLVVDAGVVVKASRNLSDYGGSYCGQITTGTSYCSHWITAANTTGSGIAGYGVLDARGWSAYIGQTTQSFYTERIQAYINNWGSPQHGVPNGSPNGQGNNSYGPNAIDLVNANNFTLYNITVKDAGNFVVHYIGGTGFTVWGAKILAPFFVPNTDGIDPENATNVSIVNTFISNGDNQVAVKASSALTSNITVCNDETSGGIALAIGANTLHGVNNVLVCNIRQNGNLNSDQSAGLQIGSDGTEGGTVDKVTFKNDCMQNERNPIRVYTNYGSKTGPNPPWYTNILFRMISILPSTAPYTTGNSGYFTFQGLDASHLLGLQFDNVQALGNVQGVAQQGGITTDQYATINLGPGPVSSSLISQFTAGTGITQNHTAGSGTAYCTSSTWQPLIGALNIKTSASHFNKTVSASAAPLTLQVILEPVTDIDTHEYLTAYPT